MNFSSFFGGPGSNFKNFFIGSRRSREHSETASLYDRVLGLHRRSPLASDDEGGRYAYHIVVDACDRAGITPSLSLGEALYNTAWRLLRSEGFVGFPEQKNLGAMRLEEGVWLRGYLARKEKLLCDFERLSGIAREKIIRIFEGFIGYLPASVIEGESESEEDQGAVPLQAPLIDLCDKPREVIERIAVTMFDDDLYNSGLFEETRERLNRNVLLVSGGNPNDRRAPIPKPIWPTHCRLASDRDVATAYLGGTAFTTLFEATFPFHIPFPTRFEHTHVVGGSGHGKTQLLQLLINHDLMKAREDGRSIVVIDSQGDLLRTIARLSYFSPTAKRSLADRLVLVDPTDVEYPVCLNMFDFDRGTLGTYSPLEREKILNGTIELYEYFFGALLGAELTQKQGVIFKYLARLMLEIPDATVQTFRQLMENGEPFRLYMQKLPPSARSFFETRFFDRSFNETKKQILTRLWGVLSNATFERMFSHPRNKVDLFEATNSGKIVLINTAKDLLQHDGSAIFGRFFIALLAQGAIRRSALPPHERRPTFVYIDEAADYFDTTIDRLLNQARKYKVGMVLAHQNLDQLSSSLRGSIFASTSIKLAGGVSAGDASLLSREMHCESEFVQGMKKGKDRTSFACFVRNMTPRAIAVTVPLGRVEELPAITPSEFAELLETNRALYCAHIDQTATSEPPPVIEEVVPPEREPSLPPALPVPRAKDVSSPPAETMRREPAARVPKHPPDRAPSGEPALLGRGGRQHQYLQQLFKKFAEERGFRAVIEEPILDGAGRVDLSLTRDDRRIACEISVTTGRDHELGNIEKCLAAGYAEVLLVASDGKNLAAMQKFMSESLDAKDYERVRFFSPEEFLAHIDGAAVSGAASEERVRGYKVRVTRRPVPSDEARGRRAEIAKVIARSMRSIKE